MKNRAKCRLCGDVLESLFADDLISCSCDEISISGGSLKLNCYAKNFANFIRIEDDGKEIDVKLVDKPKEGEEVPVEETKEIQLSHEQKVELVNNMLKYYEDLPNHALFSPVTQSDMRAVFLLIKQVLI